DHARGTGPWLFLPEVGIQPIELPHLTVGPPTEIAISGFPQIGMCDLLETACRVEAGSNLVGNPLIVDESIRVRRADGLFVKAFGVDHAAFYSRDLRAHQCSAIFEILRAMLRPNLELPVVSCQSLKMVLSLVRRCGIPCCRVGKCAIEAKLCERDIAKARVPASDLCFDL